jgi:hypothetical protein
VLPLAPLERLPVSVFPFLSYRIARILTNANLGFKKIQTEQGGGQAVQALVFFERID